MNSKWRYDTDAISSISTTLTPREPSPGTNDESNCILKKNESLCPATSIPHVVCDCEGATTVHPICSKFTITSDNGLEERTLTAASAV